jgi:hypothetical protein
MDQFLFHEKKWNMEFGTLIAYCTLETLRMIDTVRRSDPEKRGKLGRYVSHATLLL